MLRSRHQEREVARQEREAEEGHHADVVVGIGLTLDAFRYVNENIVENIVGRLDVLEIGIMRTVSWNMASFTHIPRVVADHNNRNVNQAWSFMLTSVQHHRVLHGIRLEDGRRINFPITDLINSVEADLVTPTDTLTLQCVHQSWFLFSRTRPRPHSAVFILLHVTRGDVVTITLPFYMSNPITDSISNTDFDQRSTSYNIRLVFENDGTYRIYTSNVAAYHQPTHYYFTYNSETGEWMSYTSATRINQLHNLNRFDPRLMITHGRNLTEFISFNDEDQSVFFQPRNQENLYIQSRNEVVPQLGRGDNFTIYHTRGETPAWCAYLLRQPSGQNNGSSIVRGIVIARLNEEWTSFDIVSSLNQIPQDLIASYGSITVEATNDVVQVGMLTYMGRNNYTVYLFTYDITTSTWSTRSIQQLNPPRGFSPFIVSRLTL